MVSPGTSRVRRTVVSQLMDAGNRLDDVRAFIGHRSAAMTAHYWERTQSSLVRAGTVHVPWSGRFRV